ncbi:unnamed protein product [Periconia digitata]|uniref:SWIM-type domain-containing protein n=1 Tax=Periconia digitata TaxID=1303443 RepID=A0A9W4ULQ9_9PLEO|nr:unnamed protein product [Periconia digitata]
MAPRKNQGAVHAAIAVSSDHETAESTTTAPKRSTRKRKAVNYKEPTERDADIKDAPAKKAKKTSASKAKSNTRDSTTNSEPSNKKSKGKAKTKAKSQTSSSSSSRSRSRNQGPAAPSRGRIAGDYVDEYRDEDAEVRKKAFQTQPSGKFLGNMDRALSQPLLFVDRQRCDNLEAPRETFTIAGNSGKDYTVNIRHVSSCTCMDFTMRRIPCKHIIYTMVKVLKVAETSHLLYQLALTSSELQGIFDNAPAAPSVGVIVDEPADPKRKPLEGEDCPICYMEFVPGKENITYCKSYCGNNVHKVCMDTWLKSQRSSYGKGQSIRSHPSPMLSGDLDSGGDLRARRRQEN